MGGLGLAVLLASGAWLAVSAAAGSTIVDTGYSDEPAWLAGPLVGLGSDLSENEFGFALATMLVAYGAVVWRARRLPLAAVALSVLVVHALFAVAPPLLSSDVFHYLAYAREGVSHGLNPYLHPPASIAPDPIVSLVYWQHLTSPYGPLFTLATYPLAALDAMGEVWTIKAVTAALSLAGVGLTVMAAGRLGRSRARAAAVMGLNPLLLVYGVGGAHNDLVVMAAVCGGLLALSASRARLSGVLAVVMVGLKASSSVAAPFFVLGVRPRRAAVIAAVVSAAVVVAVTLPLFGLHLFDTIGPLATGARYQALHSGPDELGELIGSTAARVLLDLMVAVVVLGWLRRVARGADPVQGAGWSTLAALVAVPTLEPWYIAWLLPFAALGSPRLRRSALVFSAYLVLTHFPAVGFAPS